MRFRNVLLRGFYLAPTGTAAEVADTDDGELTDEEVLAADDKGGEEAPVDDGAPEAATAPEVTSYKDYFEKAGLRDIPDDPAQFASRYQQLSQSAQEAAQARQMIGMLQYQLAQATHPKQEPPKPTERKKLWDVPAFDMNLKQGLMLDENGQVVVKPGYDPRLPQQYQEYQTKREAAMDQALQMLADPQAFFETHLQPTIAPFIQQQAAEIAQRQFVQLQEQTALRQFEYANREWIFQPDGVTLTPLAQTWNQHYQQAKQFGHPDAIGYAESQIKAMERDYLLAQQQQAAQETPEETDAKKKLGFLKDAAKRTANKGGSFPTRGKESPPQNGKDPWTKLRADLKKLPEEAFE